MSCMTDRMPDEAPVHLLGVCDQCFVVSSVADVFVALWSRRKCKYHGRS